MTPSTDPARQLLRHSVATVAYRGAKALRGAPDHFASFHIGDKTRTPAQILAHMGDLFDWALSIARGQQAWHDSTPLPWGAEIDRFFAAVKKFDDYLASSEPLNASAEGLFQAPLADALNHIGQIAMLRRLAGSPIKGENYFKSEIVAGRVGLEQSAPVANSSDFPVLHQPGSFLYVSDRASLSPSPTGSAGRRTRASFVNGKVRGALSI